MINIVPLYQRFSGDKVWRDQADLEHSTSLHSKRAQRIPNDERATPFSCITVATFGSFHRLLKPPSGFGYGDRPFGTFHFHVVIVEEASHDLT